MTGPSLSERIQLPERNEIEKCAVDEGVPEPLARQLGRAGGESRLPEEILDTARFLTDDYYDSEPGVEPVDNLLLTHYPGIVRAYVQDPDKRRKVLELWTKEEGQQQWLQAIVDQRQATSVSRD